MRLIRTRSASSPILEPQARFASTRVREVGDGRLRVEGRLEVAGKVEAVAFEAVVREVGRGLRLEAAATVDRTLLGTSADRLAVFLPATVRLTLQFGA